MATEHSISITDLRMLQEVQAGETVVILNASSPVAGPTAFDTPMTRRPRLGTRTSPPVSNANDAFRPLGAENPRSRAF